MYCLQETEFLVCISAATQFSERSKAWLLSHDSRREIW